MKYHLIPHIAKNNIAKDMFYACVNKSHKMIFRNKITGNHMSKTNTVERYLRKIIELRDQSVSIGEQIDKSELVRITLNGFGPSSHHFINCIWAHEKLPTFEKLWDDLIIEVTRLEIVSASSFLSSGLIRSGNGKWLLQAITGEGILYRGKVKMVYLVQQLAFPGFNTFQLLYPR
jgi:hypothetical protein